ncbi:aldehyde dehydrogenase family protein [Arthrobacter mobilis]|uniref:Aldehyde dehydrogenase family protein n=1 Tax=Arthrobacter mobilis TaxID=2724944 RepID=A0A7X6K6E3_9MICC|nr:aldehyde dehydrogenase family protein [Arthrobacter mobilis]NKX55175.1 aldehyde dehydrogenase family protein [Arthrobacter mobilis]
MTVELQHYLAGRWETGDGGLLTSTNPAHPSETVASGRQAGAAEVGHAVAAARRAARDWARTPAHERGAVLLAAAAVVEANAGDWGLELAREEGKTAAEGRGEVLRAAQILRYYGNEPDRSAGEIFSSPRRGEKILITRKPLGVVGVITPFNFPIAIPAWKIAPALVWGNTVVWKPASAVPLLAMRLAQALDAAGLPAGVLNLLIGPGPMGNDLVSHPSLDGLTFTGSTGVGRQLAGQAAARGVPMQAEMGGKNAAVVLADADLELASEQVLFGAFRSTGQKCTATSRLIVAEPVADEFLDRLRTRLAAWTVGDPTDPAVQMGPVVSEAARKSILAGIGTSVQQGAQVVAGGGADGAGGYDGGALAEGAFVAPTVLEVSGAGACANPAWREEFFGPVLTLRRAADAEEAFGLANDSEFGLSAAVFTRDVARTLEAIDELDVGILHINSESAGADPHVPFGGAKKSGYGPKEQGAAAREFFTHTTTVYLRGGAA